MPSEPPKSKLYEDQANQTLWRDLSRLFEDFCGEDESQWGQKKTAFNAILRDLVDRLDVS